MLLPRNIFAIALFGDLPRSRGDGSIEARIVPQRTDSLVPWLDFVLARNVGRLRRHPVGNRQHASTPAVGEIPPDHLRQRPAVADDRWNPVDHLFGAAAT